MTAVVAHGLGADGLGVFTITLNVVLVSIPLLALGQVEVLVRETASRPARARELVAESARTRRKVFAVMVPLAVAALAFVDDELRWAIGSFVPYTILRVETFTRSAVFKGLDRMEVEVVARSLELAIAFGGTALVVFTGMPIWGIGLAFTAGAGVALGWLLRCQRVLPEADGDTTSPVRLDHGRWIAGLPFLAISVLSQLLLRLDALLMDAFGLPRGEIGRYGAAAATTFAALAVPQLAALALYPTLSRLATRTRSAASSASAAALVGLSIGAVAAGTLILLRRPMVDIVFGPEFAATMELLAVLAWALPGASVTMMVGTVLAAWNAQFRTLAWSIPTLGVSVCLNLAWIPSLGAMGAARSAVVAHSFGALGVVVLALTTRRPNAGGGSA